MTAASSETDERSREMKWRRTLKIRRLAVALGAVALIGAATAQARPDETMGPGYEAVQKSMPATSYYTVQGLKAEGETLTAKAKALGGLPAASYYTVQGLKAEGETLTAKAKALGGLPAASYYTPAALNAEAARWTGLAETYSTLEALKSDGVQIGVRPDDRAGIHSVDGLALYDTQDRIFAIADPEELVRNEPGYAPASPIQSQPVQSVRPDNRPGTQGPGPTVEPVSSPVGGGGFDWSDWAIGIGCGLGATALVAAAALMPFRKKRKVTGRVVTSTS
jgi:hypothetical protein